MTYFANTTPRWQHSQRLQEMTRDTPFNGALTVQPSVPFYNLSHATELAHRLQRIGERAQCGQKPPSRPVIFFVVERSVETDGYHLHGKVFAPKPRQQRRWEEVIMWSLVRGCLAYRRKFPSRTPELPLTAFSRDTQSDGSHVVTVPHTFHAPSVHLKWMPEGKADGMNWDAYINKDRATDPHGDRFVFGRSCR
jgi:hypothetical protein